MQQRYGDGQFPSRRSLHASASPTPTTIPSTANVAHSPAQPHASLTRHAGPADTGSGAVAPTQPGRHSNTAQVAPHLPSRVQQRYSKHATAPTAKPDHAAPPASTPRPAHAAQSVPTSAQCPTRPRQAGRRAGRASLLAALVAMTVVVPLAGFVGPDSSVALPTRAFGTPTGSITWATSSTTAAASALDGSATAASRARVREPLALTGCTSADLAANGTRAVTQHAALLWPMTQGSFTITSPFSMRISPISGEMMQHEGIDMAGALDTPIYAVADGEIVEVSENSHSGTYVEAKHQLADGTVFYSAYLHEYPDQILVKEGDHVSAGQRIGGVGSNGWSTGPHLHFEIHDSTDTPVDPHAWLDHHQAGFVGQECQ